MTDRAIWRKVRVGRDGLYLSVDFRTLGTYPPGIRRRWR